MANRWIARLISLRYPGGFCTGGDIEPVGTLSLNGYMVDAGTHNGREVKIVFGPEELDTLAGLVADATRVRDAATQAKRSVGDVMTSIHNASQDEWRRANGLS